MGALGPAAAGGEQTPLGDFSKTPNALSSNAPSPPLQPGSGPLSPGEPAAVKTQASSSELQQPSPPQYGINTLAAAQSQMSQSATGDVPEAVDQAGGTRSAAVSSTAGMKPNPEVYAYVSSLPPNTKQRMSQALTALSESGFGIVSLINSLAAMRAFNWLATLLPDKWFKLFLQDFKFLSTLYENLVVLANKPVVIENPFHFDTNLTDDASSRRATEILRQLINMFAEDKLDMDPIMRSETAMRQLHWFLGILPDGWPEELKREQEFLSHLYDEVLQRAKNAPGNPSLNLNANQSRLQQQPSPAAIPAPSVKPATLAVSVATANQQLSGGGITSGAVAGADATSPNAAQREEFQKAFDEFKQFISESLTRNPSITSFLQENAALFRNNLEALTRISNRRPDLVCC